MLPAVVWPSSMTGQLADRGAPEKISASESLFPGYSLLDCATGASTTQQRVATLRSKKLSVTLILVFPRIAFQTSTSSDLRRTFGFDESNFPRSTDSGIGRAASVHFAVRHQRQSSPAARIPMEFIGAGNFWLRKLRRFFSGMKLVEVGGERRMRSACSPHPSPRKPRSDRLAHALKFRDEGFDFFQLDPKALSDLDWMIESPSETRDCHRAGYERDPPFYIAWYRTFG